MHISRFVSSRLISCCAITLLLATACKEHKSADAPEATDSVTTQPTAHAIEVRSDSTGLIFRYYDADARKMKTARSVDAVPKTSRAQVIVIDEGTLATRRAGEALTVADLRTAREDGTYATTLIDPFAFDSGLPKAPAPERAAAAPVSGDDRVIIFTTEGCPHCRHAEAFLKKNGIKFVKHDVEKDPTAGPLLMKLGKQAGADPALLTAVPILWIKGRLLVGFDEKQVRQALGL